MTSKKVGKLLLVDGSALMHRAYHALPSLTNRQGQPTGAVYGFIRMLLKAVSDLKPHCTVVTLDRKEPTFRKSIFIGYQAHRPPMEKELGQQFEKVKELLSQLQVPVFDKPGFEADDLIGTITKQADISEVVILSGDKDLMQLVNNRVKLYLPTKGVSQAELVGPQEVEKKLGIKPEQVVDYKALVGDPSDNYPGVYGIGPKTAVKLLNQYRTFDNIYHHLDQLPDSVRAKLEQGRDSGRLSRQLAAIKQDVDFDFSLRPSPVLQSPPQLSQVLSRFGFPALAKQVSPQGIPPQQLSF